MDTDLIVHSVVCLELQSQADMWNVPLHWRTKFSINVGVMCIF